MVEKCPPSFKPFRLRTLLIGYNWNLTTVAWCYQYIYAWIFPKEISKRVTLSSPQVPGGFIQDSRHFVNLISCTALKKIFNLLYRGMNNAICRQWTKIHLISNAVVISDVPFPKTFLPTSKKILTRLFRVFVHVYIHHFDKVQSLGAVSTSSYHIAQ